MTDTDNKSEAAAAAKAEGRNLRDAAVDEAKSIKDAAVGTVKARAEGAKDGIAAEVSSVGDALRTASDDLRTGSPQEQVFGAMANGLADFSDALRGKSLGELVDDVSDFGRRNPAAFLGGAALLGFAAVRMAKASKRDYADDPRYPVPAKRARTVPARPTPAPVPHPTGGRTHG